MVEIGGWPLLPFHCTVEAGRKLSPFTVSTNPELPAAVAEGETDATDGASVFTEKEASGELIPAVRSTTLMAAFCPAAMSIGMIAVESRVALTKEVVRSLPFHWIAEDEVKLAPLTVNVNPGLPATADAGEREVMDGI